MARYKVVMLEPIFSDFKADEETLREAGADLVLSPNEAEDTLLHYVSDADAIVSGHVKVTERLLDAAKRCKIVAQAGIGVDNIDIAAATRWGIYVAHAPGY